VMGANLLSLVTSQTYAPAVALLLGAGIVVVAARRFPWSQVAAAPPVLATAAIVFWPSISGRLGAQLAAPGGSGLPESLQTRIDFWQAFFVPALLRHGPWLGTGTLMPPEVPRPLVDFVDNGYLWQLFRAGVPGLAVLLAMLAAVAAAGWAARRSDDPSHRVVGLTCVGAVAGVVLMDTTSEYLTFTAVSQEFWMLVGLLGGFAGAWRRPAPVVPGPPPRERRLPWLAWRRVAALAAPGGLLRSSAVLTAGNAAARFLSLLFSIAAARFLAPAGYGVFAYGLVVANAGAVLIMNTPLALTRSLARHRDDRAERDAAFTNWLAVMTAVVIASVVLMTPAGLLAGLRGWLLPALLANLLGTAVLQTYQQIQCGLERFGLMVGFWALANLLQLAAALAAGLLGLREPALFLAIYGLSSVAALAVLLPAAPLPLRLRRDSMRRDRVAAIARYAGPLALMNAFTTVWLGADVVLVERMLSSSAAGRYAAAKVIVNGFAIVSWAVSSAVLPQASRLARGELRAYLLRALGLTAAAVVPLLLLLTALARPLLGLIFGDAYLGAPLGLLALAMALYALAMVLESAWLGLGRPVLAAVASGAGMAVTVAAGLALVPRLGLEGAALATGAGAAAQLAILAALTVLDGRQRGGRPGPERSERSPGRSEPGPGGSEPGPGGSEPPPGRGTPPRRSEPAPPLAAIHLSRPVVSAPALLHAWLRRLATGAPVALSGARLTAPKLALRLLGPDLLLVGDADDRDAGRAAGVRTELVGPDAPALLAELELDHRTSRPPAHVLAAARAARLVRDGKGLPRRLLWRDRPGYVPQRTGTVAIVPVEDPAPAPVPAEPRSADAGAIEPSPVATAAGLLGLPLHSAGAGDILHLADRALAEHWELLAAPAPALAHPDVVAALAAFAGRGGTLVVDGLDERSNAALRRFGVPLPEVRPAASGGRLLLPAVQAAFAGPLAGTAVTAACGQHALTPVEPPDVLAWAVAGGGRRAVVVQRPVGRGRIVLSTLPAPDPAACPADVLGSNAAGGLVVALLLLRQRYGKAAWHAPLPVANFTIDDPALRQGLLGLRYDLLAAQARDHRFHVTVATVPGELPLAAEPALRRLREHPELLSACYHGCDHEGYEFPTTAPGRTRYAPRPLATQRDALRRAVERGRRFARARGHQLDRVMVFPYGVGPARLLPELHRLGFLATCNYWDKYPLEAPVPAEPDLGLRPADLAWEGFPLLWRRSLDDQGWPLDLLLGRPVLHFAHRRDLGRDFLPFAERARTINRATGGGAEWRGLADVARHAYLQRRRPGAGWEVLMTANEACLHNPDANPRTYAVTRPHLPAGSRLRAPGGAGEGPVRVTVPPGATAVVRVEAGR
ncbi:MAG TPA: oligosaccharide flippase family protein, partial [Candidatus Dormibacteraeota bacterium]|nr:oligosaccharide flippase family protein [Candidatus Dormibacteraeota bacterium]